MVFQSQGMKMKRQEATQKCLDVVPRKLLKKQQGACKVTLSLDELSATLHEMADDKSPKPRRVSMQILRLHLGVVGLDLLQAYKEALCARSLGARINQGII
jgi:hypothetical protein